MTAITQFRITAFLEGVSFILLLFVAMPLKYLYDYPLAVRVTGMAHGVLFILFCLYLFIIMNKYEIPFKTIVIGFISAFIPFGTFFYDAHIRKKMDELGATH